ncbi:2-methylcitrate dehydratase PrpD [Paraburkholderia sp. JPY158]|uniref:2-methylcitrate dehydratase PrpD n=1 Tax=Paraburkholderia atlantica TaxID=2654982 RepID=A0A7W8V790_PARAM|nr:MmgE/PrpD family protein [Paraburkholderia atlantica]MBB5425801.1 2-methylcitrate dehydratase PrpD [Paraburkholderia atlantica]
MAIPTPRPGVQSTVAQTFARFCTSLEFEALPPLVVERAKHFFIDYIAIALRGSILDSSRPMRMLAAARPIPGGATLLGRPDPVHAAWAALANGMAAHSMELDDTFLPGSIHNESFVLSPALALAEERGASGKRFITAVVAGFEVACRVAAALKPAVTNARGFHPTGTTGALGAAATSATLLGLDAAQVTNALGVACSQAAGLLEFVTDGAWTKRFHGGWASHAGMIAAELAQHGITAPPTSIEGKYGYLHAYSGDPLPQALAVGEGEMLAIAQTALKFYPCNYYIQSINDSVLQLAVRADLPLEAIESIVVHTVQAAMPLVCEPIERKRRPRLMIDAQFSVPFNVALGLVKRRVSFVDFTPAEFTNPAIERLMDRVTCCVDPALDAQYPAAWPARVEITLADGRTLAVATQYAKGDPRNPLNLDEVIAKHRSIVAGVVDESTDDAILDFILRLETKSDFSELTRVLKRFVLPR